MPARDRGILPRVEKSTGRGRGVDGTGASDAEGGVKSVTAREIQTRRLRGVGCGISTLLDEMYSDFNALFEEIERLENEVAEAQKFINSHAIWRDDE